MKKLNTAFTLIEMLVVIAIISMLLAILMPVTNRVKHLAAEKVCSSNIRQIFFALSVYSDDFRGFFPLEPTEHNDPFNNAIINPDDRSHRSLLLKLGAYKSQALSKAFYCTQDKYLERVANDPKFEPPGASDSVIDSPENRKLGNIGYIYWSFAENKYFEMKPWRNPKNFIPRQLTATGVRWLYSERPQPHGTLSERWVISDFFRQGAPFPHVRKHARGLNVTYLDGHVDLAVGSPKNSYR